MIGQEKLVKMTILLYVGAKLCEFIAIYFLSQLCTIIIKNECGLYRGGGLMVQKYISGQQIDQLRKKIINCQDYAILNYQDYTTLNRFSKQLTSPDLQYHHTLLRIRIVSLRMVC